jgi:hypothetical protein
MAKAGKLFEGRSSSGQIPIHIQTTERTFLIQIVDRPGQLMDGYQLHRFENWQFGERLNTKATSGAETVNIVPITPS